MKGTEAEACELSMQACIPKVTRVVLCPPNCIPSIELRDVELKFSLQDDCTTLKIFTSPRKRSDVAKDLHTPKYRQRVKPDKKKTPKGPSLEDMLKEQE